MEAAGIPTVALATYRERVERICYPRAAVVRFPRGATCGPPHVPALQREVLSAALRLLETATTPGVVEALPHRFADAA